MFVSGFGLVFVWARHSLAFQMQMQKKMKSIAAPALRYY